MFRILRKNLIKFLILYGIALFVFNIVLLIISFFPTVVNTPAKYYSYYIIFRMPNEDINGQVSFAMWGFIMLVSCSLNLILFGLLGKLRRKVKWNKSIFETDHFSTKETTNVMLVLFGVIPFLMLLESELTGNNVEHNYGFVALFAPIAIIQSRLYWIDLKNHYKLKEQNI